MMPSKNAAKKFSLATCDKYALFVYLRDDRGALNKEERRRQLIFAAGALNNRKLLKELGCMEQLTWYEGRRAVDISVENPYTIRSR